MLKITQRNREKRYKMVAKRRLAKRIAENKKLKRTVERENVNSSTTFCF
jgi:hypothetical protein